MFEMLLVSEWRQFYVREFGGVLLKRNVNTNSVA